MIRDAFCIMPLVSQPVSIAIKSTHTQSSIIITSSNIKRTFSSWSTHEIAPNVDYARRFSRVTICVHISRWSIIRRIYGEFSAQFVSRRRKSKDSSPPQQMQATTCNTIFAGIAMCRLTSKQLHYNSTVRVPRICFSAHTVHSRPRIHVN